MKKLSISLVCGIAAMVITILLYFIILGNIFLQVMHFLTLIGVLVAEAVCTAFAYFSKGNPRRVAAAVLSLFMIPFSVILSGVYITSFPNGYATYCLWYAAGMIAVLAIAYILIRFDSKKTEESDALAEAKENMLKLRKLLKCVSADPVALAYTKELRELDEKLRFSNDSVIAEEDGDIAYLLREMADNIGREGFDFEAQLAKLNKLVDRRSVMTARNV